MGEDALTQTAGVSWGLAILLIALAFAAGWVGCGVWRSRTKAGLELGDAPEGAAGAIESIEAEIRNAKALLDEAAQVDAAMTDELKQVDEAVKRANGRLKLVLRSIDRAPDQTDPPS